MKILKKYDTFIKENQDIDLENEVPQNELQTDEEIPGDIIASSKESSYNENDPEEEENEYVGRKMLKELARKLGTTVSNNSVSYEGKTINFFSETEKFHVDKKKFTTVDEVVNYLSKSGQEKKSLPDDVKADIESSDMGKDQAIVSRRMEDEKDRDGFGSKKPDRGSDIQYSRGHYG